VFVFVFPAEHEPPFDKLMALSKKPKGDHEHDF